MLDDYIGGEADELKKHLKDMLSDYRKIREELEEQNSDEAVRSREMKLLEFEIQEIEEAGLDAVKD